MIGTAAALGFLCIVIPPSVWLRVAGAFSPDGEIGDPGVARLVAHSGRALGVCLWAFAAGYGQRARIHTGVRWIAACPTGRWLVVLAAAVVLPRVLWMLVTHTTPHVDLAWYDTHARHLAAGAGYLEHGRPTAFWPIGYPAFLAVLYGIFGPSLTVVKLAQVALAYATGVLLWRVGRSVLSEGGARLAALGYALCPSAVMFTELVSTETLFATVLVGIWHGLLCPDYPTGRRRVGLGVLLGVGVLIKPVLLPWPAFALLLHGGRAHPRRALLDVVAVYAIALAVVAPWTVRNYRAFDRVVLVSTNAGFNLYVGNGPGATGAVRTLPPEEWAPYDAMHNEAERDAALRHAAVAAIRADPGRFLRLIPAKLVALFRDDTAALRWAASAQPLPWSPARALVTRAALDGYYYACLLLAGYGVWRRGGRANRASWLLLASWAAYLVVVHAVYYGDPRYHQAMWPLLALAAAGGLSRAERGVDRS